MAEDFPRGKSNSSKQHEKSLHSKSISRQENVVHQTKFASKPKKRKLHDLSNQKSAKRIKLNPKDSMVEIPLQQDLREGVCVLACVRQVHEYSLSLSLPGNGVATLPITDISAAYSKQLQILTNSDDSAVTEEVKSLAELFKPGLLLPVTILEVGKENQKKQIKVSCDPSKVNSELSLKTISKGQLVFGNIASVEDHGYMVDLGVKGIQAFLAKKDADAFVTLYCNGSPLSVGCCVWSVIQMNDGAHLKAGEERVVNVTIDPKIIQNTKCDETTNLNSLRPGMSIKGIIQQVLTSGLQVTVRTYTGTVHSSQLPKTTSHYMVGKEIDLRILYINHNTKVIHFTALPKLLKFDGGPINFFNDLKIGSIVKATVTFTHSKRGVFFKLPGSISGFASLSHLNDKKEENVNLTQFQKGASFQCRVLGFSFMDALALVSLKKDILEQKFMTIDDVKVGDIVETVVKQVNSNGLLVKLSRGIFSFIPCLHLADVPIKHPDKKFESGMKLKCRVLRIDKEKSKVFLTHKKSLLKSKLSILSEYTQLQPKMELEGFIVSVKEKVVIVSFYNNVKGYVTRNYMSTEKVIDPSSLFYKGQVIRCHVVHYNVEEKKLKLSFNFGQNSTIKDKGLTEAASDFKIGMFSEAKVMHIENAGVQVMLLPSKHIAHLPFFHMSDFSDVQELRKHSLTLGQKIEKVAIFSNDQKTIVTVKESLMNAAEKNQLVENFDDLKTGMLLPGVIKNHQDYGMFLELANGHIGLIPAKTLTYLQPVNLNELFIPGQTVICRLSKIDFEKKRFLGSIHINECFEGNSDESLELLKSYLSARECALTLLYAEHKELSVYKNLKVGEIVEVTVSSVLKKGILCDLKSGAKALVTKYHFGEIQPKVGCTYKAAVLFVDPLTPCVELSLQPKVVKSVANRKENIKTQLKKGQILKAEILLIKSEFLLMGLRGHGAGKFVYVPVKQHMNDVEVNKSLKIGNYSDVVLKDTFGENQLAVFKVKDMPKQESMKKGSQSHDLKPGMLIEAKIKAIHSFQINIISNRLQGRIHITEVADELKEGENPLLRFHPEQTLNVKIIGLRDLKSHSYLPITDPKPNKTLLECSLKESRILNEMDTDLISKLDVKEGDKVFVFVIKVSKNKVWAQLSLTQQGYIDFFHLSDDTNVINNASGHFLPGQGYTATVIEIQDEKIALSLIGKKRTVVQGEKVIAQITKLKPGSCLCVKLASGRLGVVYQKPTILHYVGQYITCVVKNLEDGSDRCVLSLVDQSNAPVKKVRKRKREVSESEEKNIFLQKEPLKKKIVPKNSETVKETIQSEENTANRLNINGFSWEGELAGVEDSKEIENDNDSIQVDNSKANKRKKHNEEKLIQEFEQSQLDRTATPQSANDFEKLVLQSPNSSLIWLRFMAFHIELGEIDKARTVAEKALNTITFREEQEKMNVWLAYLNMETMYGDISDVKKLLERAAIYNNPVDIYLKMADIYISHNKMQEADELYQMLCHKFKHNKAIWKSYGQFLYKTGKLQLARNLLKRATCVLDKKDHIEVITKFANCEFSDGDSECGRTMFENLIASYPNRTDLWSVYVDMVSKVGDISGARQIMERAVKQKLNTKRLRFLIQKFIRFEETHGSDEQVKQVKELALTLLET
ncbi:protein RRP5 homolog [Physella acuta]|uniref:protein RRP5 homolog n=1 Tax=Physella acuta TaxID=109671 RepID=UPI0027DD63AF|nr:protein RRP5 homolog [Physella acuta]